MSNKDLLRTPHNVKDSWWYEDIKGITVCQSCPACKHISLMYIQWRSIRKALARKDEK